MFFTPSNDFLDDPPPLPESRQDEPELSTPAESSTDGSLAIGSLKGTP
jgi:porphyrinogen peroxidase